MLLKTQNRLHALLLLRMVLPTLGIFAHGSNCSAQTPPMTNPGSSVATSAASSTPALSLTQYDPRTQTQSDVVFGRGIVGPYTLSWKNAHISTETVVRAGAPLLRDIDYRWDNAGGTISFTNPLSAGEMVRISYRCDTADVLPNSASVNLPYTWDIWQKAGMRLRFSSLLNAGATGNIDPSHSLNTLQLGGILTPLRGTKLDTGAYFDLHGGDWLDRGGFKLGEQSHAGTLDLGFLFSRGGTKFAQEEVSGIHAGRETEEANGQWSPLSNLKFTGLLRNTQHLFSLSADTSGKAGAGLPTGGESTREAGGTIDFIFPVRGLHLTAGRLETLTSPAAGLGSSSTAVHDSLNLATPTVAGTQATIAYDANSNEAAPGNGQKQSSIPPRTYTQTTTVSVRSQPDPRLLMSGSYANSLYASGVQDSLKMRFEATPLSNWKQLKLTGNWEDTLAAEGTWRKREASIELPALLYGRMHLSGGAQQNSAPGQERVVGLLDARLQPLSVLELTGGLRLRDGMLLKSGTLQPDSDAVNTYDVKMNLTPTRFLKFTGGYARNPELNDGSVLRIDRRTIGAETTFGFVSLRGQYAQDTKYLTTRLNSISELGVDLHLSRTDTLTTSYRLQSLFDKTYSGTGTYLFGFTHRAGSLFDFSLNGTMTNLTGTGRPEEVGPAIKAEAKLGLHF